jgi:hypothetical protein
LKTNPSHQEAQACPVCQGVAPKIFQHAVLQTAVAMIHLCPDCDYLFAAQPDWLEKAYQRVINTLDTGCLARTESMREQTALPIYLLTAKAGRWLDYGGGHGGYVRRMRDAGFDFRWHDPMAENLFAGGFEGQVGNSYQGVTSFECLEHFTNPTKEIQKMISMGPRILFSTELRPEGAQPPESWWYYGWEHGQHVGFHSKRSLARLAETFNLRLVTSGRSPHAFLPTGEEGSLGARLIFRRSLSLASWCNPAFLKLLSPKIFVRSLLRGRIVSKDFLKPIEKLLGSKTWPDHEANKRKIAGCLL